MLSGSAPLARCAFSHLASMELVAENSRLLVDAVIRTRESLDAERSEAFDCDNTRKIKIRKVVAMKEEQERNDLLVLVKPPMRRSLACCSTVIASISQALPLFE